MDWSTIPQDVFCDIASHWDVATLVDKQRVCRDWKQRCTDAIDAKRTETTQKAFSTKHELRTAVMKYCGYTESTPYYVNPIVALHDEVCQFSQVCSREDAEEIATTYGWPINKWDVFNVQDLSRIFWNIGEFNEDIGSWNTANATLMWGMFDGAEAFNQDISSWDVSNVTGMAWMFHGAESFNQNISRWDTSNVTDMRGMFEFAVNFNQDLSPWITSNVTKMGMMFVGARSFSQNLSQWDRSNVTDVFRTMTTNCLRLYLKDRVLGIIPTAQQDSKQDSTVLTQDSGSRVPTPGPRQTEQVWVAVDHRNRKNHRHRILRGRILSKRTSGRTG
jgi:surface protein